MYVTRVSFTLFTHCESMSRVSHLHWLNVICVPLTLTQCHIRLIYIDSLWVNVTCLLFTLTQCMSHVSHWNWFTVSQCHKCLVFLDSQCESMSHLWHWLTLWVNVTCVSFFSDSMYVTCLSFTLTQCHVCLIYIDSMSHVSHLHWLNVTCVLFTLTQCMSHVSHLHSLTASQCHVCLVYIHSMSTCLIYIDWISQVSHLHWLNVSQCIWDTRDVYIDSLRYTDIDSLRYTDIDSPIFSVCEWVNVNETHVTWLHVFDMTHSRYVAVPRTMTHSHDSFIGSLWVMTHSHDSFIGSRYVTVRAFFVCVCGWVMSHTRVSQCIYKPSMHIHRHTHTQFIYSDSFIHIDAMYLHWVTHIQFIYSDSFIYIDSLENEGSNDRFSANSKIIGLFCRI